MKFMFEGVLCVIIKMVVFVLFVVFGFDFLLIVLMFS